MEFVFCLSRPALGPTQPPIQWILVALNLGVKRSELEADHSPPSSSASEVYRPNDYLLSAKLVPTNFALSAERISTAVYSLF
jgi:hypothetical protein